MSIQNQSQNQNLITKVSIEHFPSRAELYSLLDIFLAKHNLSKDYTAENKDNLIIFYFKNPVKILDNLI